MRAPTNQRSGRDEPRGARAAGLGLAAALTLLTAGCEALGPQDEYRTDQPASAETGRASAAIEGRSGVRLSGRAEFVELSSGVQIDIWLEGAPPGMHAVHVHEIGDCSASDGTSAGGHFNPDGHDHGGPDAAIHHAGDLGNMWVEADGTGHHTIFSPDLTVAPGTHSVVGRAIIVHASEDDLISQPTGAAGGRIGCGEIN